MEIEEIFNANNGFLRTKVFTSRIQWNQLNRLIKQGKASKIKPGLYRMEKHETVDQMTEVANMICNGVFCMFTAWNYYELSSINPPEFHVAIREKEKIILPDYPPVKLYYWSDKSYCLGVIEIEKNHHPVKIYDLEKSVCDAVRFRNKIGMNTTTEILKNYVKKKDKDLDTLIKYAGTLRIARVMQNLLTVLL
ncbi:MAG: hypothetical protein LBS55_11230 [Prevotellaceae bacterium]|jgi:predicted transcriptional regulator of viral defense system|nr:hypothetical protein [Prevotellaceae bacterium]